MHPSGSLDQNAIHLFHRECHTQARRIEPFIILGSHGFAEIAVNQGNAAEAFCLKAGDRIELEEI